MGNDDFARAIHNLRAEIDRLEERLAASQVALGKLAAFLRVGQPVWYEASPGRRYAAVVDSEPREMGAGQVVVRLRVVDDRYLAEQKPTRNEPVVPCAATWCLEPRTKPAQQAPLSEAIHGAKRSTTPHSDLTQVANAMLTTFAQDKRTPEHARAIVMLTDGKHGGVATSGYDKDSEAIADLVMHLQGVLRANGKDLKLLFEGKDGTIR